MREYQESSRMWSWMRYRSSSSMTFLRNTLLILSMNYISLRQATHITPSPKNIRLHPSQPRLEPLTSQNDSPFRRSRQKLLSALRGSTVTLPPTQRWSGSIHTSSVPELVLRQTRKGLTFLKQRCDPLQHTDVTTTWQAYSDSTMVLIELLRQNSKGLETQPLEWLSMPMKKQAQMLELAGSCCTHTLSQKGSLPSYSRSSLNSSSSNVLFKRSQATSTGINTNSPSPNTVSPLLIAKAYWVSQWFLCRALRLTLQLFPSSLNPAYQNSTSYQPQSRESPCEIMGRASQCANLTETGLPSLTRMSEARKAIIVPSTSGSIIDIMNLLPFSLKLRPSMRIGTPPKVMKRWLGENVVQEFEQMYLNLQNAIVQGDKAYLKNVMAPPIYQAVVKLTQSSPSLTLQQNSLGTVPEVCAHFRTRFAGPSEPLWQLGPYILPRQLSSCKEFIANPYLVCHLQFRGQRWLTEQIQPDVKQQVHVLTIESRCSPLDWTITDIDFFLQSNRLV